ncbi:MAG: VOC family protein [bacterium]
MGTPPGGFMGLQHIAIKVHDIEAAIDFYVNKLGFTVTEIYTPGQLEGFPFGLCFMRCHELHHDFNLIFWPKGEVPAPESNSFEEARCGLHHVAIRLPSKVEMDAWDAYLKEEGIEVFYGPVVHSPTHPDGDGFWGENRALYFCDPSGNAIELFCDMAPMDPATNQVNKAWFRDRLERDGHPGDIAEPPPAWKSDYSFLEAYRKK